MGGCFVASRKINFKILHVLCLKRLKITSNTLLFPNYIVLYYQSALYAILLKQ
jgi:hypothetical protein